LDQAAQALDPSKDKPGAADLIYRGGANSIQQWKKLAYSMMLRLAMRLVKVDAATAKTWAEKAYAGGVITSNADNAYVLHDATGGRNTVNRNSNILGIEWNATDLNVTDPAKFKNEVFLSKTLVDYLKINNDPRTQFISKIHPNTTATSNSTLITDQVGLKNGYDQNGGTTDVSNAPGFPGDISRFSTIRGDIMLKADGPTFLITAAQNELLLAEAAKRGWNVGSASTHYINGVTAAMQQLVQYDAGAVIPAASVTAYLTAHPYTDSYDQINTQYWLECYENLDFYEAWANWRRSGFPVLTPVNYPGNATNGQIPRRMLYPTSESSSNSTNYQEAISRQGANTFTTKVWWDK
jgi:hypothetical protein